MAKAKTKVAITKEPGTGRAVSPGGMVSYSVEFKRHIATEWASGRWLTDNDLAAAHGITRHETVSAWRVAAEPDGIPWQELRQRAGEVAADLMTQELGESIAKMNVRHALSARHLQTVAFNFLTGRRYTLANGQTLMMPQENPENFGQAVNALLEGVRIERLVRGQPDSRQEVMAEMTVLLRRAFERANVPPALRAEIAEAVNREVGALVDDGDGAGDEG